jgi:integrase
MSLFRRGNVWWFKFRHQGLVIRESSETEDRAQAAKVERKRHSALDEGGKVKRRPRARLQFGPAVADWLALKEADWSKNTARIEATNFGHLATHFKGSLRDISAEDISHYKAKRKQEDASPKTVALEIGSLRALMKRHKLWADIQPDVKVPKGREDVGRALSHDEEHRLLVACKANRSRSLYPAVLLALHTGLRSEELRLLRWRQIELIGNSGFPNGSVTVGKSKTRAGAGRVIPLSKTAQRCLMEWRSQFPGAQPAHFVFCSERYGATPDEITGLLSHKTVPYAIDPTKAIGPWKASWNAARKLAGVDCRAHDLRHSFISRLAESQASDATIMSLAGHLSRKMMERYSHTRNEAKLRAISVLDRIPLDVSGSQKGGTVAPHAGENFQ